MKKDEKELPFFNRFLIYQKERFPLVGHGLLITCFTFSAVSYSRICRGQYDFISTRDFIIGIFATITIFFLVRIFDEFKDREDDAKYRKYLPVPRGLISFKELSIMAWTVAVIQIAVLAVLQWQMLWLYAGVIAYLLLMRAEFFVPLFLKKHQILYITSHMVIIPLIDMYSSGLDWHLDHAKPHTGLLFFFAVSFMNGIVLEFGRKLRAPGHEEEGVVSYTKMYGVQGGTWVWIICLLITGVLAVLAADFAGYGWITGISLAAVFVVCVTPAFLFLIAPTQKKSKFVEYASGLWTLLMYLILGAAPMLQQLLQA